MVDLESCAASASVLVVPAEDTAEGLNKAILRQDEPEMLSLPEKDDSESR